MPGDDAHDPRAPRSDVPSERLVRELATPEAYPHAPGEVEWIQTHISWLFFAGQRVYKVKKPVDLGFLDFTRLEDRRHFCEEEVRLNRRLAPDVYRGVVAVRSAAGKLRVDAEVTAPGEEPAASGAGEVAEWAVEMTRLPADRMLAALLERGEIDNEPLRTVSALLADFHRRCPTGPGVDEHGTPEAVAANAADNFEALRAFASDAGAPGSVLTGRQLDFLEERSARALRDHRALLERRVKEGRVREGHGDLHAENLCFTADGVVAYDCIEFSRSLRCGDVASDVGFLAMDLDARGHPAFSRYLLHDYAERAGDPDLLRIEPLYKGYRAVVRAKVAALTASGAGERPESEREEERREAMRYVHLAASYELPPVLVLTCGLPATGKSWLAARLATPLRAAVLRSDVRRKVLAGAPREAGGEGSREGYGTGLYTDERRDATYRSLLSSALEHVRSGQSVLVDATFAQRRHRELFADAAARLDLPWVVVHVTAPEAAVRERLEARRRDRHEASDADLEVYLRAREAFEPPDETSPPHRVDVTSGNDAPEDAGSRLLDARIAQADGGRAPCS